MHSGGGQKLDAELIIIEAPEEEAIRISQERFNRHPSHVTCTCCGDDFSISEWATLEEATAYERGCAWSNEAEGYVEEWNGQSYSPFIPLADFLASDSVMLIRTSIDAEVIVERPTLGCEG